MLARMADLAKFEPKGSRTGKGKFSVKWDRAVVTMYVTIDEAEGVLRATIHAGALTRPV